MKPAHAFLVLAVAWAPAAGAQDLQAGRERFAALCAGCHGTDGGGGEHAPGLADAPRRGENRREAIRKGIPEGGMPAFSLPEGELDSLLAFLDALRAPAAEHPTAGDAAAGRRLFVEKGCSACHMIGGWGGVLSTAGGLVFFCDDSGAFAAVDARTGRPLWHFHTNSAWHASPMTYSAGGRQFVAVAAGGNVIAFALP